VRRMSQICPTAVEHIFDGRRTKPEKMAYSTNWPNMTLRIAKKGAKSSLFNIHFDIL
jgi:hypothetical protein